MFSWKGREYDVLVIGAGFSGAVMAERFASQKGFRVLVLEKRAHIGGNCYDKLDENGIRIHQYGPHLFHTSHEDVWSYLNKFTEWHPYEHQVLGFIDGKLAPVPFNLNSIDAFFPESHAKELISRLLERYEFGAKVPILELLRTDDLELKKLSEFIYNKLFLNYTCKQWGCNPDEISPEVTARVPVVISRDNRYFHDKYQAVPSNGYTGLVENLLAHGNIKVDNSVDATNLLSLKFSENTIIFDGKPFNDPIIYTGMLDELFDFTLGELPYRSLKFKFEHHSCEKFQPTTTVNYPNDEAFTRITEFKHIMPEEQTNLSVGSTIVKEYPQDYNRENPSKNIPYYPIFNDENELLHKKYLKKLKKYKNLTLVGRLAQYKYFNMDDAVKNSLDTFSILKEKL